MNNFDKIIIANWKMNLDPGQSIDIAKEIHMLLDKAKLDANKKVILCPSFLALYDISKVLSGSQIDFGAQDVFYEDAGAFTGEISPDNLKKIGCKYTIVGHSERRAMGETDDSVNKKVKALIENNIIPIICIGEKMAERQGGKTSDVLIHQIQKALEDVPNKYFIVAYEPVWAISTSGSGQIITPAEAKKELYTIREAVPAKLKNFDIIYGGSVGPDTVTDFVGKDGFKGALVGGASLEAKTFVKLIKNS
ncbi:triose-phosphate isomerase [Candidatus Parcubacteria bacterium]|jgi:triosephosphate isomerase|nr:triose-phosphate isomerase [Candidatus Parcubacteria bacterium]MBT7227896.1 triose-phosphate isomerase [Candidatus Parcubacteria bacterium]